MGCILEHQILRFAGVILRDKCSTSYDLASLFGGRRSTLDRWSGKIGKRIGSFLMLSTWKTEDISQNSFVFDVVKFKS